MENWKYSYRSSVISNAGRRTKFAHRKSLSIFRTLLRIRILRIFLKQCQSKPSILVTRTKLFSANVSSIFSVFYYTSIFLRILRILLHFKHLSHKTNQDKRSENLLFSRNLVTADRKRRGQGGLMWTKDHKRSDANHIESIWFRVRQRIALSWGSWGCRKVTLMPHPLKWPPQASLGAFPFAVWKNWREGIHESTAQRKEHSKMEFGKKNSEKKFGESETFCRSKFSRATGVLPRTQWTKCFRRAGSFVSRSKNFRKTRFLFRSFQTVICSTNFSSYCLSIECRTYNFSVVLWNSRNEEYLFGSSKIDTVKSCIQLLKTVLWYRGYVHKEWCQGPF